MPIHHNISALLKFSHLWLVIAKLPAMFLLFRIISLSLSSRAIFVEAQRDKSQGNPHATRWVDCAQHVPESTAPTGGSLNSPTIDLRKLPSTLYCGRIDVLMDYSKPFCDNNKITLGLATYRPQKSRGLLFFCLGGTDPGLVTIWEAALNISDAFTGLLISNWLPWILEALLAPTN